MISLESYSEDHKQNTISILNFLFHTFLEKSKNEKIIQQWAIRAGVKILIRLFSEKYDVSPQGALNVVHLWSNIIVDIACSGFLPNPISNEETQHFRFVVSEAQIVKNSKSQFLKYFRYLYQ